jgi:hypothetical protein
MVHEDLSLYPNIVEWKRKKEKKLGSHIFPQEHESVLFFTEKRKVMIEGIHLITFIFSSLNGSWEIFCCFESKSSDIGIINMNE